MALTRYLFETGPDGAALTNANSGSSAASVNGGSTSVFSAAHKAHGNLGARFINASGQNSFRRYPLAASATTWQFSGVFTMPATPASAFLILGFPNASGTWRLTLNINTESRLVIGGVSGTTTQITNPLTAGAKYRVTLQVVGGSATSSNVIAKIYAESSGAWVTQLGSTWTSSTFDTGTDAVIGADIGVLTSAASAYTMGWDDIQLNNGAGGEIDDIVEQLATPVVTLGAATNPSTVGGSDGSQVVTWAAVPGASSYEAWIANGATPAQGDFTRVATNVTSPYTFTGLTAGERAYGIKAKA